MQCETLLGGRQAAVLALALLPAGAVIVWLGTFTDVDLRLADAMFDPAARRFPWRHAWLAEGFAHGILKVALTGLGTAIVAVAAWDLASQWLPAWWRVRLRIVALSALLVPLAIALLKQASSSHCPWDLQPYAGTYPYVRLLESMPADVAPGHCLPAGHASSALWMVALCVFWLPARPRMALVCSAVMLGFGFAVGWVQQLRGAHFLTHTLWSMWIAGAVILAITTISEMFRDNSCQRRKGFAIVRLPAEMAASSPPCGVRRKRRGNKKSLTN